MQTAWVVLSPRGIQEMAERSPYSIHLTEPQIVIDAIRVALDSR